MGSPATGKSNALVSRAGIVHHSSFVVSGQQSGWQAGQAVTQQLLIVRPHGGFHDSVSQRQLLLRHPCCIDEIPGHD